MPVNKYSPEQKDEMVKRVDALRAGGKGKKPMNLKDACRAAGVNLSIYNWWKAHRAGKHYAKPEARRLNPNKRSPQEIAERIMPALKVKLDELEASTDGAPRNGHNNNNHSGSARDHRSRILDMLEKQQRLIELALNMDVDDGER